MHLSSKIEFYAKFFFFKLILSEYADKLNVVMVFFLRSEREKFRQKLKKKNVYSFQIAITTYVPSIITKVLHSLLKCY